MTDEKLDEMINRILQASGSDIKHYTMDWTKQKMRDAMRSVLKDAGEGWYVVNQIGIAFPCAHEDEARKFAAFQDREFPMQQPHKVGRVLIVGGEDD